MADIPQPVSVPALLGNNWTPTPLSWTWLKGNSARNLGTVHILVLEASTGRIGLAFTEDDLAEFVRTAQTQMTGLAFPRTNGIHP